MNRPASHQIAGVVAIPAHKVSSSFSAVTVCALLWAMSWALLGVDSASAQQIRLKCGTFDPLQDTIPTVALPATANPTLQAAASTLRDGEARLELIQWTQAPNNQQLKALQAQGVKLIQPVPDDAYIVAVPDSVDLTTSGSVKLASTEQPRWTSTLTPAFKLHPVAARELVAALDQAALSSAAATSATLKPYNVQIAYTGAEKAVRERLESLCAKIELHSMGDHFETWTVQATAEAIQTLALDNSILWIEPMGTQVMHGERGGLSVAGIMDDLNKNVINPGTYQSWLKKRNVSGAGIIVQVMDDGLSQGIASNSAGTAHADIIGRIAGIDNATTDLKGDSAGGHGHINASIIMGQPKAGKGNMADSGGFLLGQGVAPDAKVFATKVFPNDENDPDSEGFTKSYDEMEATAYEAGARVSSNSWGQSPTYGEYTASSQAFDRLTRDADSGVAGLQAMTFCFSAGNDGSNPNFYNGFGTVSAPSTAKNVISVGAGENNTYGIDRCRMGPSDSDDMRDIASFSSRGPANDGRILPTLFAPGVQITGAASDAASYNGTGVCGRASIEDGETTDMLKYYPAHQTYYTWSSGTSHSCPIVAGAVALYDEYYKNKYGTLPSPAMAKAAMIVGAVDTAGGKLNNSSGGTLGSVPNNHAGWGRANIDNIINGETEQILIDQTKVFTANGETFTQKILIPDSTKPLRIALTWTDAPGALNASKALVNDLDLTVSDGTHTWKGNNFSGGVSQATTVSAVGDHINNMECVFLPNPSAGVYTVTVTAYNLAGDALPNQGELLEQDFALFMQNAGQEAPVGQVEFDRDSYTSSTPVKITLTDSDLRRQGTANVTVTSQLTGDTEVFPLTEDANNLGIFTKQFTLDPSGAATAYNGILTVVNGDVISAKYTDNTNDAQGNPLLSVDTAKIDMSSPSLVNISVTDLDDDSATLSVDANKPVQVTINYGAACGTLNLKEATSTYQQQHTLSLSNLSACTPYFYNVVLTDEAGNSITVTNNGSCFVFQTKDQVELSMANLESSVMGWSQTSLAGTDQWGLDSANWSNSAPNAWHHADVAHVSDTALQYTPSAFTLLPGNAKLIFYQYYDFEPMNNGKSYDGAVLEITTNGGSSWEDLGDKIVDGGYTATLDNTTANPLGGRSAWCGSMTGTSQKVVVDLSSYVGKSIKVRWRIACDSSNTGGASGWWIDDIQFISVTDCIGSMASIAFDKESFNSSVGRLRFVIRDKDLSEANGHYPADFRLANASTPAGIPVVPTDLDIINDDGIWEGYLAVTPGSQDGYLRIGGMLEVKEGEWIRLIYTDSNVGGTAQDVTTQAFLDNTPPTLTTHDQVVFDVNSVTLRLASDEPVLTTLQYGTSAAALDQTNATASYTTLLYMGLIGLTADTPYLYKITITDRAGNATTYDNDGFLFGTRSGKRSTVTQTLENGDPSTNNQGWSHGVKAGSDAWSFVTSSYAHSTAHAWFAKSTSSVNDSYLLMPAATLTVGSKLSFWHTYSLQDTGDGAVIELSMDGGATWTDLGPYITKNGYNRTIATGKASPIAGRQAWSGGSLGAMKETTVNLESFAGPNRLIRFRLACDQSSSLSGWYVDDISLETVNVTGTTYPVAVELAAPVSNAPVPAGQTLKLNWQASQNATKYQVYYGLAADQKFYLLTETTETSADLWWWNLRPNTSYVWRVVAVNEVGSTPSPVGTFTVQSISPAKIAAYLTGDTTALTEAEQIQADVNYDKVLDIKDLIMNINQSNALNQ